MQLAGAGVTDSALEECAPMMLLLCSLPFVDNAAKRGLNTWLLLFKARCSTDSFTFFDNGCELQSWRSPLCLFDSERKENDWITMHENYYLRFRILWLVFVRSSMILVVPWYNLVHRSVYLTLIQKKMTELHENYHSARLLGRTRLVLEFSDRNNLTNNIHFPEDRDSYERCHGFQKAYEARTAQIKIGLLH
jgi:hypothetical protein